MDESRAALSRNGELATLLIDAPPRNLTDLAFFDELSRLVNEVLPGLPVRGLVVAGRGRHFSAGANLEELKRASFAQPGLLLRHGQALAALEALPYPVVAAIDGCCLGSGLELALACHYRVATPSALFALPEATFGLIPGCGGTVRLPSLVGVGPAIDLLLSGRCVDAAEALELGAIDALVPKESLLEAATSLLWRAGASPARG